LNSFSGYARYAAPDMPDCIQKRSKFSQGLKASAASAARTARYEQRSGKQRLSPPFLPFIGVLCDTLHPSTPHGLSDPFVQAG
jgi:hypothetical protein